MISSSRYALGPPTRLWLMLVLLLGAALPAAAANPAQIGSPQAAAYCYSWDVANYTGEDADDLHIRLEGVREVNRVYDGGDNPFGPPAATSGYDAGLNAYRLDFTGGPALAGDIIRLGICTPEAGLHLDAAAQTPPFYWSAQGRVLPPPPLFAGLSWEWQEDGGLRLRVHNEGDAGLVLWSLNVLTAEQPLLLDDLHGDNLAVLPAVAMPVDDPVVIPAGGSQAYDIAAAALGGPAGIWLVELTASAEDDLDNVAHLYSQAVIPTGVVYLPLIMR